MQFYVGIFPRFSFYYETGNFSNTSPQAKYPQRKTLAHFNNETIIKHHQQALKLYKYRKKNYFNMTEPT